jgi:AraC-like DNA-binding protein
LTWRGAAVDAQAYRTKTRNLSFYSLRFGDEVAIRRGLYRECVLAHVALRNSIEFDIDERITHVPEGAIFFSSPQKKIRVRWQENCEHLVIPVPLHFLCSGDRESRRLVRSSHLLAQDMAPLFINQLNLALKISRVGDGFENLDAWVEYAERGLAEFAGLQLFEHQRRLASFHAERCEVQPSRDKRERLESFIQARMKAPITLDDLTAAVGVGRTQLNQLCQEGFDCSPMALVRRMRLQAARFDLERNPHQDFTNLSLRYGFEHQSRFAQYYRASFGELPRETRRRLLGC